LTKGVLNSQNAGTAAYIPFQHPLDGDSNTYYSYQVLKKLKAQRFLYFPLLIADQYTSK